VVLGAQQLQQPQPIPPITVDTAFHQVSLTDALRLAHENNVSNITAANAIRQQNNTVRSTRAQLYPNLTFNAGQSKSAGQRVGPNNQLIDFVPAWSYNTGLSSQITLFDGGRTFADTRAARANVSAAEAAQVNTEFNIALQVKQAYNAVLAARELEGAARAQLATAQQQLSVSIARVNAGAANVSDSLRNVVAVGTAQLNVLTAQNTARSQSAILTRLVGTPYFVTAQLSDTTDRTLAPIDSTAVMQLALTGPPVRQAEANVNVSSAQERSAKAAYLPTLSTSLNYSGSGTAAVYGLNGNPYPYTRGISFNFSYPIFNRFQRENAVASAQISRENAEAQVRDARLQAQQSIITALASLRNAEETMRVQQTNVRASEEDLRVVQQRYALGAGTLLDVLTSQAALVNARQQLISARLNYRNARAQIEAAIGRELP
jgi:outer membrane protein